MGDVVTSVGDLQGGDLGARTRQIVQWLTPAASGLAVAVANGAADPVGNAVVVRLRGVSAEGRPKQADAALDLVADFGVSVVSTDPVQAHSILGELAFHALAEPSVELLATPPSDAGCPSLVLRVRLRRARAAAPQTRVRERLRVVLGTLLEGVVLGPADLPLEGAELTIRALGQTEVTGADGRFRFDPVPPTPLSLTVLAKGRHLAVSGQAGEPLTIRVPLEV